MKAVQLSDADDVISDTFLIYPSLNRYDKQAKLLEELKTIKLQLQDKVGDCSQFNDNYKVYVSILQFPKQRKYEIICSHLLHLLRRVYVDQIETSSFCSQISFSKVRGKQIAEIYSEVCKLAEVGMLFLVDITICL